MLQRFAKKALSSSAAVSRRGFAAADHAPPKKLHGTSGRYASAAYIAASKAGKLDKVEAELQAFNSTMTNNATFATFLSSPTVAKGAKSESLSKMLDSKTFSDVTRNLLLTMSANGRIDEADKVVSQFMELMEASRGSTKVTVTSAEPLKKKSLETIQTAVQNMVGKGVKVTIDVKEDPAILGGLQILIGDKFMDLSIVSRVNALAAELDQADM